MGGAHVHTNGVGETRSTSTISSDARVHGLIARVVRSFDPSASVTTSCAVSFVGDFCGVG